MRSLISALALLSLGALTACNGGQPRVYRMAVDTTPTLDYPSSCFSTAQTTTAPTESNIFTTQDWLIFDGAQKQYLDLASLDLTMGEAPNVNLAAFNTIEGGPKEFTASITTVNGTGNSQVTTTKIVTVTFDDTPGNTASGNINIQSNVTCATSPCSPSCNVILTFNGRKIEGTPIQLTNGF